MIRAFASLITPKKIRKYEKRIFSRYSLYSISGKKIISIKIKNERKTFRKSGEEKKRPRLTTSTSCMDASNYSISAVTICSGATFSFPMARRARNRARHALLLPTRIHTRTHTNKNDFLALSSHKCINKACGYTGSQLECSASLVSFIPAEMYGERQERHTYSFSI